MAEETVKVALRIRPFIKSETDKGCKPCIEKLPGTSQVQLSDANRSFSFNYVFTPEVSQKEFYETAVRNMLDNIFEGYNITILAYGQTGSGKTHSMGTHYTGNEDMGIIPRAMHHIFQTINSRTEYDFAITVSFIELYQELLYDLLTTKPRNRSTVDLREDGKNMRIVGATELVINSTEEALECLTQGSLNRATGATAMNEQSSRSHAIFTVSIKQQKKDDPDSATTSKFHLVDLAGSERSKKTQATGERFKEGITINKGLFVLGNVISQLGEGNSTTHIAYRDSKLTRLLQDSLGGNSVTLMIACVSPADYNIDETLSTLRYADRALRIKNKPIINQDPSVAEINRLKNLIKNLKSACSGSEVEDLKEKNQCLRSKNRELRDQLNQNLVEFVYMHERADMAEKAREKHKTEMSFILDELKELLQRMDENPDNFYEHRQQLRDIYLKILALQKDQCKTTEDLWKHEMSTESSSNRLELEDVASTSSEDVFSNVVDHSDTILISELFLDEKREEHTSRQAERNNEVQNINRELAIKEAMISRLLQESTKEYHKELETMEHEIKKLQNEKSDLLLALENVHANNVSSKLAESRRLKVQELEKKITELSRKCLEQNKAMKSKEQSDQRIKILTNETQTLKSARVKLIKQMRSEAEIFTKLKLSSEREINRLKDQDRKRVNQIARLQTQHDKKQNVFKRKIDEVQAVNKRLKEALDVQAKANQKRLKTTGNSVENIQSWVTQEFKLIASTIDAEYSLQTLKDDQIYLAAQLKYSVENGASANEIKQLEELIELRESQIVDLKQQILESDQDNKSKTRFEGLKTIAETKKTIEILFDAIVQDKKQQCLKMHDYRILNEQFNDLKNKLKKSREKERALQTRLSDVELDLLNSIENKTYEIDETMSSPKKLKSMENNHQDVFTTPQDVKTKKRNKRKNNDYSDYVYNSSSGEYSLTEDDIKKDPDWTKTPLYNKVRSYNLSHQSTKTFHNESERKGADNTHCACKTKCASRLCSCRKQDSNCTNCDCDPNICQNRNVTKENAHLLFSMVSESDESKRTRMESPEDKPSNSKYLRL